MPNFLKHRWDAHEISRHCETKNFRRKNVIALLCMKFFDSPKFLKNCRIPLRNFSALWDLKISTEDRDMPPLVHNFFSMPEIFWKTEGFLYKAFRFGPVRQKNSMKPWCPSSYAWKFSIKEFFWNTKVFSNGIFWYSETKTFRWKIVIPPSLLSIKFFPYQKFLETQNGSLAKFFRSCQKKNFDKTVKFPPSFARKFSIPEFFRHTEVFSYEFYRHCETKILNEKSSSFA